MDKSERPALVAVFLAMVALIGLAAAVPDAANLPAWGAMPDSGSRPPPSPRRPDARPPRTRTRLPAGGTTVVDPQGGQTVQPLPPAPAAPTQTLPHGATKIFGDGRFLVAYYGTAETGALGVLGETSPDAMQRRVHRAAEPFARKQPAGPGRLRADRQHRRPARRQGRRLLPRHPARRGAEVHRRRAPPRRTAAAGHPAGPGRLPHRRQALGLGAQGPVRRPGARPGVADGQARRPRHPDRLGRRR